MTNDLLGKLKGPSIGLLITGVVNVLYGIYSIAYAIFQFSTNRLNTTGMDEAQRMGFYVGFWGATAIAGVSALIAPFIIYGALQMMRGRSYGLSKTASILALIPVTSCCFLLGIPFGIWALVTLGKPEIKNFFQR